MISDRKLEHLLICENYDVEFKDKTTGFEDIELIHNVLPEIDKNEIDLSTSVFGKKCNYILTLNVKFLGQLIYFHFCHLFTSAITPDLYSQFFS